MVGLAREADRAERFARGDMLSGAHGDASLFEVAILGVPALAVVDPHPVATGAGRVGLWIA